MVKERTVIVLANRKGGVGKTKSCVFMAEVLRRAGKNVTGIDMDPERGWQKYARAGFLNYPVTEATAKTIKAAVQDATGYVVVDTPPNDAESLMKACLIADEVFVPLAATGDDMSRLDSTLADIVEIEEARGTPLTTVFLTRFNERKIISREAISAMTKREIPVADQKIRQLTEYEMFAAPQYLDEYEALLKEAGVL